jgi:hypothetical protein
MNTTADMMKLAACKKKSVKLQGRDKIEVEAQENVNADKEASNFNDFQRKPQSKSVRYSTNLTRQRRTPRMGTQEKRNKKL